MWGKAKGGADSQLASVGKRLPVVQLFIGATAMACAIFGAVSPAQALPSFAQQTGQPCSQCHVGAYGPQLKPYGRDFKLYGYVSGDGKNTLPPITAILAESYTHTQADRPALPHHDPNDNVGVSNAIIAYGGDTKILGAGAFAEAQYDALHHKWAWAKVDVRRTWDTELKTKDLQVGVEVNNRPGLGDLWNSTPVFEFNTTTSGFAATPSAAPYIDGKLGGRVAGPGVYAMFDNTFYGEFNAYQPFDNDQVRSLGVTTPLTADVYVDTAPYWRLAAQRNVANTHYWQVGAFGLEAKRYPNGNRNFGTDSFTDTGFDATYQYTGSKTHFLTSHVTWIHEDESLDASRSALHTNPSDHLNAVRLDAIYSYKNTWSPSVQLFQTTGSNDVKYFKTPTGSPDSRGYVLELMYSPWGKIGNSMSWGNMKLVARYIGYDKFNGSKTGASANNTFFLSATFAVAPFSPLVKR